MRKAPLLRALMLGALTLLTAGAALAKPPAYTLSNLGFATTLHGIPEGERREACFDAKCSDTGGVVVAEGQSRHEIAPVKIVIREHKKKGAGKAELEKLAKKSLGRAPHGKQVRLEAGTVAGRPALEQWSVWDSCERVIAARVLVALPDKIIEIETQGTLEPGHDAADSSVSRMTRLMNAVRVRRLGDAALDPAREPISTREMAVAMPRNGCLPASRGAKLASVGPMPAHRLRPPARPVTITLDGEPIVADEGEPVAQALVAADKLVLARSPKLHRPRGPSCLKGGCDGCLVRLDGVPNVTSCLVPAREGMQLESQNTMGTRTVDLLRVTDWFFPDGMDHHKFLAGVPGLSGVMQAIARRVAGLGTLPTAPMAAQAGKRSSPDVLVVGAGPSGLGAASALSAAGLSVVLVDDALELGGSARALGEAEVSALRQSCPLGEARVLLGSTAAGAYEGEVLIAGPSGAEIVRPRALVLATGAHDGVLAFDGNDLPGVFSARAAARLAAAGVAIGQRVVIAGRGPYADALSRLLEGKAELTRVASGSLRKVEGSARVGAVVIDENGAERRLRADALAVEAPPAPAFELAEQAGARVLWGEDRGFLPGAEPEGRVAPGTWVAGELRGLPAGSTAALTEDGRRVAQSVARSLARPLSDAVSSEMATNHPRRTS